MVLLIHHTRRHDMTAREANELIGKLVDRHHDACAYQARIIDVKTSYGTDRVLLEPVAGSGSAWANLDGLCPYEATIAAVGLTKVRMGRVRPFPSGLTSVS